MAKSITERWKEESKKGRGAAIVRHTKEVEKELLKRLKRGEENAG